MLQDLPFLKLSNVVDESPEANVGVGMWSVIVATVLIGLVFVVRLVDLQLIQGGHFLALAENNRVRKFAIFAERGVVFDRTGEVLVRNIPAYTLQLNTGLCDDCSREVEVLGKLTNIPLRDNYDYSKNLVILASGLSRDQILPVETNLDMFRSISILVSPVREYVYGDALAHVLGYVGLDDTSAYPKVVGKAGLEDYYNSALSGIDGYKVVEIDSAGQSSSEIYTTDALPGRDIYTSLDAKLQAKAYEMLKAAVDASDATGGAIVAQDPTNGAVINLVSYPAYDPNRLVLGVDQQELDQISSSGSFPFFNRAIAGAYPPGSVFKMVIASAALSEKVVTKDDIVFDPGFLQVGAYIFRNWKLDGHGDVDMLTALQKSNDTYFYTVGSRLGIEKLHTWATKFWFGKKTQIDLNGEVSGYFPNGKSRDWYLGDTIITSIGQGDTLTTPLQINNMVAYFANGGFLYKPQIVQHIEGDKSEVALPLAENLISQEDYSIIKQGMNMAVNPGGTAYPFFDFETKQGIKVYGKTGTAEFVDSKGEISTHAWFSVFIDEKKPIVMTVFLENGGGGSDDAAPIARSLMDFWLAE